MNLCILKDIWPDVSRHMGIPSFCSTCCRWFDASQHEVELGFFFPGCSGKCWAQRPLLGLVWCEPKGQSYMDSTWVQGQCIRYKVVYKPRYGEPRGLPSSSQNGRTAAQFGFYQIICIFCSLSVSPLFGNLSMTTFPLTNIMSFDFQILFTTSRCNEVTDRTQPLAALYFLMLVCL